MTSLPPREARSYSREHLRGLPAVFQGETLKIPTIEQIRKRLEYEAFDYAFRTLKGPRILRRIFCRTSVHRSWIRGRLPVEADHTRSCYRADGSKYQFLYPVRLSISGDQAGH